MRFKKFTVTLLSLFHLLFACAQTQFISSVEPTTAATITIDSIPGSTFIIGWPAYNQTTNHYSFFGSRNPGVLPTYFYTVNTITGSIVFNPVFPDYSNVDFMFYSRSTGVLYGVVTDSVSTFLASLDPSTATYTKIKDFPSSISPSGAAVNEASQRIYFTGSTKFLVFDLATTSFRYYGNFFNVKAMIYDNTAQTLRALYSLSGYNYVCTVDTANGSLSIKKVFPSGIVPLDEHVTFDENQHHYYFAGAYSSNYYLYTLDINTGGVLNSPAIPMNGSVNLDNLAFFRYDNILQRLFALQRQGATVPVVLSSFKATMQHGQVVCRWQTTQETNTNRFEIERSLDGVGFKKIGSVPAAGYSAVPRHYSFVDETIAATGKKDLYYRLKMIDNDARFTYSNIDRVNVNEDDGSLTLYPNPVKDKLFVSYNSPADEHSALSITDVPGNKLYQRNVLVKKGKNNYSVDVTKLPKGAYSLSLSTLVTRFIRY